MFREMKDEKIAEVERKRTITKERKLKAAEKLRLEEMAKRVRPFTPLAVSQCLRRGMKLTVIFLGLCSHR